MRKQTIMIKFLFISCLLVLASCVHKGQHADTNHIISARSKGIFIAKYGDFGPPQRSSKLIGNKWWQWDAPENHKPVSYNVYVVVYRVISLDEVKLAFPVIPAIKQDYRYVSYDDARKYFDKTILDLKQEMAAYDDPESVAMMSVFPLRLYETALAMERKLRE